MLLVGRAERAIQRGQRQYRTRQARGLLEPAPRGGRMGTVPVFVAVVPVQAGRKLRLFDALQQCRVEEVGQAKDPIGAHRVEQTLAGLAVGQNVVADVQAVLNHQTGILVAPFSLDNAKQYLEALRRK